MTTFLVFVPNFVIEYAAGYPITNEIKVEIVDSKIDLTNDLA